VPKLDEMCRSFLGGCNIITDYGWYLRSFHGAIDENSGHSASVNFLGCPVQHTGFARRGRNDDTIHSKLQQSSGMIQFILNALIGIADDHLITVSSNGGFDGAYDPSEE
jgi:hypothetical protein